MRIDLAFIYLGKRLAYRFVNFFVHWYGHTFFIFKKLASKSKLLMAHFLIPTYWRRF